MLKKLSWYESKAWIEFQDTMLVNTYLVALYETPLNN